jgi:hypothetical protein
MPINVLMNDNPELKVIPQWKQTKSKIHLINLEIL